ncbi:MAG: S8 family serine peptidase [Actinomycetota bacterium]|nr:S8 family serine peptidase [Actinomycetota bacterium]
MDTSYLRGARRRALGRGMTAVAVASLMAASLVASSSRPAAASPAHPAPGAGGRVTIVAQFASDTPVPGLRAAAALGVTPQAEPARRYVATVPAGSAAAEVARLRAQAGVRYAEISDPVHATGVSPDDVCYVVGCSAEIDGNPANTTVANQAYLNTIDAPAAWGVSTGSGVKVAVLDTGADANHPDLQGKIIKETNLCGADPACADTSSGDDNGHGTHVTGILAADTDNTIGVASVGWNVQVDVYKVLDAFGDGYTSDVDTAIYDAVAAGDRVINLSLANYSCQQNAADCGPDPDEQAAVEYAIAHNVVVVAAAGNGYNGPGDEGATYPASYPGVLAVAATDNSGAVANFSQWGRAANIAAPGVGIVSTWNDGNYAILDGTSMSTPQVSAAAALVIAHRPSLSAQQVVQILETTARPTRGGEPINGGLLDVGAAVRSLGTPSSYLGYDMAGADGSVYSFGSVGEFGSVAGAHLAQPVVSEALMGNGQGYWLVAADGGVFSFGSAGFHGSTGGIRLARPVVGMAATPDGKGYWLVASDGGIFAFGDAGFYGSTGGVRLNQPVVGIAPSGDGRGYWLAASDGGIFGFGDAGFHGSTGGVDLARPVVGMAATPSSQGYWLVAADGGVFSYGDARFYGSTGGATLPGPVVAVAS